MLSEIGKILFVDDRYDDDIKQAITELVERGFAVQYWNGEGTPPETIRNARVIVMDLDLAGVGSRSGGIGDYAPAIAALHKIPGPYLVIILAQDFTNDDPSNLENYYRDTHGPICGYIAKTGLSKAEEAADPSRLNDIIIGAINDTLKLIFLWEAVIDKGKDKAMQELFGEQVEEMIVSLVKLLWLDVGRKSAPREIVSYFMRLVLRKTREGQEFKEIKDLIDSIGVSKVKSSYPTEADLKLYNKLIFFKPDSAEGVWTGDIRRIKVADGSFSEYAIVLTPKCDFVLRTPSRILICKGFPLEEKHFDDPHYPPLKNDAKIAKRIANDKETLAKWVDKRHHNNLELLNGLIDNYPRISNSSFEQEVKQKLEEMGKAFVKYAKDRYLEKSNFPESFHVLYNFEDGSAFPLCFDLNSTSRMERSNIENWERICRLDSPFIEEMLEKYGSLSSRVGVPCFNRSGKQLKDLLK